MVLVQFPVILAQRGSINRGLEDVDSRSARVTVEEASGATIIPSSSRSGDPVKLQLKKIPPRIYPPLVPVAEDQLHAIWK
jgi:hypothetical protein